MKLVRPAISLFILMTLMTGAVYPLATTALAQWWFPSAANGSFITYDNKRIGSVLIGQNFTQPGYFQGRPSATSGPYNPLASSGSNLAVSNPALDKAIKERIDTLRKQNPQAGASVPVELVTASGSGLDPDISPDAAHWQVASVATARHLSQGEVSQLVDQYTTHPLLSFMGEPVVNVLQLNIALDELHTP